MDLDLLKGQTKVKKFCDCRAHNLTSKYVCIEPSCGEKFRCVCAICFEMAEHKDHDNIEIKQLFYMIINQLAGNKEANMTKSQEELKYEEVHLGEYKKRMQNMLLEVEVLFKTVKLFYKESKRAVDKMIEQMKSIPTTRDKVYFHMENVLKGKHWKEQTQKGLDQRLKEILKIIEIESDKKKVIINAASPEIKRLQSQAQLFLQQNEKIISQVQKDLEQNLEMIMLQYSDQNLQQQYNQQVEIEHVYTSSDLKQITSEASHLWIHQIDQENTFNKIRSLQSLDSIYFDIPGQKIFKYGFLPYQSFLFLRKFGQSSNGMDCIVQTSKKFEASLTSLLLNFNSWNLNRSWFDSTLSVLNSCKNLNSLVLNLYNLKVQDDSNDYLLKDIFTPIQEMKQLSSLNVYCGKWKKVSSQDIKSIIELFSELTQLESFELQMQECLDHTVNDMILIALFTAMHSSQSLQNIQINLDRWFRKGSGITEISLNYMLSQLMQKKYKSFALSIYNSEGISPIYLKRLEYELHKIKYVSSFQY